MQLDFIKLFYYVFIKCITVEDKGKAHERSFRKFLSAVERVVNELAESVLVDAELLGYRQSLVVAGLYSAAFDIMKYKLSKKKTEKYEKVTELLDDFYQLWNELLEELFGECAQTHIDKFGRFVILR